jgi:hypothetical protein
MKIKYLLPVIASVFLAGTAIAQPQGFPVSDQQPVVIEGLSCGYHIKSLETKEVSDKGNFSRYSISFFVKNVSGQPRIIPFRPGLNGVNVVQDMLVQFICTNATGYRLTSKYAVLKAPPYNYYQNGGWMKMGNAIMPGQTISVDEVMIVPLNEPLNMLVYYIGYTQQLVPLNTALVNAPPPGGSPGVYAQAAPPQPLPVFNPQSFYQIKNMFFNTFLNTQTGIVSSSNIQNGWWSAQWQVLPIPNTSYYEIKNRWKSTFIDTERGYITMAPTDQSPGCQWTFEPFAGNLIKIKNVQTGQYLSIAANQIRLSDGYGNEPSLGWLIQ